MNGKIKEMAVKAIIQHYPTFDSVALYGDYSKSSYNKEIEDMMLVFAELILKECVTVCEEKLPEYVPYYDCELRRNTVFAIDFVKERIKNHFGINDERKVQ